MRRTLALMLVSLIAATIPACAPASQRPRTAALSTSKRSVVPACPSEMVWDRGKCRPRRGIVIEQETPPPPPPPPPWPWPFS